MKNETPKNLPTSDAGRQPTAPVNAPVEKTAGTVPLVAPPVAAGQSVPLFGGHRGGGKKRKDGLPAGSPEAEKADRDRDARRKRDERAAKKMAALPPPLPPAVAPAESPNLPLVDDSGNVPLPLAPAVIASAPAWIAWSQKQLEKPAKLLTRILDRVRCWQIMKRVRLLKLKPEQEKEIADDLKWREEAVGDFSVALSNCAAIEFNRRHLRGAEHSHWIDLTIAGGELAIAHINTMDRLEKMVQANRVERLEAEGKGEKKS